MRLRLYHFLFTLAFILAIGTLIYAINEAEEKNREKMIFEGVVIDVETSAGGFGHSTITNLFFKDGQVIPIIGTTDIKLNTWVKLTLVKYYEGWMIESMTYPEYIRSR